MGDHSHTTRPDSVLTATSSGADKLGKHFVALCWTRSPDAVGYNLYRSSAGPSRSGERINGHTPICSVRTCADLKAIIPPGSAEWNLLTNAFTGLSARAKLHVKAGPKGRAHVADTSVL